MLQEIIAGYNVILASNSPRRKELLKGLGINFSIPSNFDVDESFPADMNPEYVPVYLSAKKSDGYPQALSDKDILLTADTVVIKNGIILGKPENASQAFDMLSMLSDGMHKVVTGVTLKSSKHRKSFSCITEVEFDFLSEEEIYYYINKYSPYDKAGSYGIQEWIGYVGIKSIRGSFYNVMGLPVQMLYRNLKEFVKNSINDNYL
ncbi:MAG: Maf family nucleotide pyrophosphatase [Rikenellaceae bacterium]|nr:Maf family nucleotide pyrophosphatase [Rikenellaceae bacterium]